MSFVDACASPVIAVDDDNDDDDVHDDDDDDDDGDVMCRVCMLCILIHVCVCL